MAKRNIGYLLPAGDAYTDEVACMMLMYPDKPEYRQALFGALDYFGTWLAWERDDDKKGKDAARAWAEAILLTRECMEMNTCETMLALLTEIRDNTGVYCCDVVDVTEGDQYTDAVEDGVEDEVPQNIVDAGYATDVDDWDGFYDYKCMISHLMILNIQAQTVKIESIMLPTGAVVGGVAALAAIVALILAGTGLVLVFGIVLAVAGVSGLYAAIALLGEAGLSDLVDDLETNYDALVCAIYEADGSAAAVDALKDAIDELFSVPEAAFLKNLNLSAQLKALYAGRYDQQDVAEILADKGYDVLDYSCVTCGLPAPPEGAFTWPIEITGITINPDPGHLTIESSSHDGESFVSACTKITSTGRYVYVDMTVAPSPYWDVPGVEHRGIVYSGVECDWTDNSEFVIPLPGYLQDGPKAGHNYSSNNYLLFSNPGGSYEEDIFTYLGMTNSQPGMSGTHGLDQDPNVERTIRFRFYLYGNTPPTAANFTGLGFYWALNNP